MPDAIQITYRDVEGSEPIDSYVRKRADKLLNCGHQVLSCRIAVEAPHRHKLHGRHYRVRIDLTIPGAELVVDRWPKTHGEHENLYAAIDGAFEHAVRRLHDHADRSRSEVRTVETSRSS